MAKGYERGLRMSGKIDAEKIEYHIREILIALGDNPEREGIKDTPKRVAKMFEEVFEGMQYTNLEIARMFGTTFDEEDFAPERHNNMVIVRDISIHSYCEHHLALMYNMKVTVAYIPKDRVIGLSKIARIADMVGKRLQLQERIGTDIANIISEATGSDDIVVIITGDHSCMTARGIKKQGANTKTTTFKGVFEENSALRQEVILLIG